MFTQKQYKKQAFILQKKPKQINIFKNDSSDLNTGLSVCLWL